MRFTFSWSGLLEAECEGAFRALDEHHDDEVDSDQQVVNKEPSLHLLLAWSYSGFSTISQIGRL